LSCWCALGAANTALSPAGRSLTTAAGPPDGTECPFCCSAGACRVGRPTVSPTLDLRDTLPSTLLSTAAAGGSVRQRRGARPLGGGRAERLVFAEERRGDRIPRELRQRQPPRPLAHRAPLVLVLQQSQQSVPHRGHGWLNHKTCLGA